MDEIGIYHKKPSKFDGKQLESVEIYANPSKMPSNRHNITDYNRFDLNVPFTNLVEIKDISRTQK